MEVGEGGGLGVDEYTIGGLGVAELKVGEVAVSTGGLGVIEEVICGCIVERVFSSMR